MESGGLQACRVQGYLAFLLSRQLKDGEANGSCSWVGG